MMQTDPSPADTGDARRRKRRDKVSTACEVCRARKRKCDGRRPRCHPCEESGAPCRWASDSRRGSSGLSNQYIRQLESRVRHLENEQTSVARASGIGPSPPGVQPPPPAPPQHVQVITPTSSTSIHASDPMHADLPRGNTNASVTALVDTVLGNLRTNGFYGNANIGHFVSVLLDAVHHDRPAPQDVQPFPPDEPGTTSSHLRPRGKGHASSYSNALPQRKAADSLLSMYWAYIHPIFPFVDQVDTIDSYQRLWTATEGEDDDPLFLYTLNIIFALTARLSPEIPPDQRSTAAETFYSRAREAMPEDVWNLGTFRSVQAMLLLGNYFHTLDAYQCWFSITMAVRTAQGLGLHLPEISDRMQSVAAQNLARRVWYGCVMMDRIVAMTFGRPALVSSDAANAVSLPLSVIDEDLRAASGGLVDRPGSQSASTVDFFIESIKLYEILNEMLKNNESLRQKHTTVHENELIISGAAGSHKSVLFFDAMLSKFMEELPHHLRHLQTDLYGEIFARQAVMMRQRYLHMRTILLRPTLSHVITHPHTWQDDSSAFSSEKLQRSITLQCAIACVETSMESVKLIKQSGPSSVSDVGLLHAWPYNILYLYTTSTILAAGRHCEPLASHLSEQDVTMSWNDAISAIQAYEQYGPFAKRVADILQKLDQKLRDRATRRHHSSAPACGREAGAIDPYAGQEVGRRDASQAYNSFQMFDLGMDGWDLSFFETEAWPFLNDITLPPP